LYVYLTVTATVYIGEITESVLLAVGCDVLTAVAMKSSVNWDIALAARSKLTDFSEEHVCFIIRAEDEA
jgi:hypothetical protein